ncbi:hypothetical protein [Thioalkalivibrio thiocyanodenitrificans]|uniref:hypothetical protein n=1 Tax=Thioalkalivibrio thiocyanodenitrificans TaxID=243063 RepID=UPI000372B4B6|nr:hypothetical protein [Thioalkalivibrio thiocyanodenitrificans]
MIASTATPGHLLTARPLTEPATRGAVQVIPYLPGAPLRLVRSEGKLQGIVRKHLSDPLTPSDPQEIRDYLTRKGVLVSRNEAQVLACYARLYRARQ